MENIDSITDLALEHGNKMYELGKEAGKSQTLTIDQVCNFLENLVTTEENFKKLMNAMSEVTLEGVEEIKSDWRDFHDENPD